MNLALYYGIYREKMDKQVILKYTKYVETRHLYYLIKNYIWRA